MRFKNKPNSSLPTINLIPMLDVMMTVLTFFVLVSMMLTTAPRGVDVNLPREDSQVINPENNPNYLLVELKSERQILLDEKPMQDQEQLQLSIKNYLEGDKKRTVLIKAQPNVSYEWVIQVLAQLREIGGDRVSLAVE